MYSGGQQLLTLFRFDVGGQVVHLVGMSIKGFQPVTGGVVIRILEFSGQVTNQAMAVGLEGQQLSFPDCRIINDAACLGLIKQGITLIWA